MGQPCVGPHLLEKENMYPKLSTLALLVICLSGCVDKSRDLSSVSNPTGDPSSNDGNATTETFDRSALMANLADNVIIPNYQATASLARAFAGSSGPLADYCESIGLADEDSELDDAKAGWRTLMDSVQKTEMHVLGPALRNDEALHNRIHSYSTGSLATCGLDLAVVASASGNYQVESRAFNQRGMSAVEYLLFNEELTHTCSSQIAETANWNDLTETERKTQRCNLAMTLAEDISAASNLIAEQWTEGTSPYRDEFLAEESLGENFQMLTDAMFYIETYTKSQKLAIPLGINNKCSSTTCPGLIESPYSENSLRNIQVNTTEFLKMFNGDTGIGFDDLIVDEGFADIALRFQNQLADVNNQINQISGSLVDHVALVEADLSNQACVNGYANPDTESTIEACNLAGLLKRVTDDFKIEFVTIVGVALPDRVQSDND